MKINSMYKTISGEVGSVIPQGHPCFLIRTQGCNLRCSYCDAKETQDNYGKCNDIPVITLVNQAEYIGLPVLLTGGEPLIQEDTKRFISECITRGIDVQVETNGTQCIFRLGSKVGIVADYKFDGKFNICMSDLHFNDWVKFVVKDMKEVGKAFNFIKKNEECNNNWAISPVHGAITPNSIARKLIENKIPAVLNIQLHKLLDMY